MSRHDDLVRTPDGDLVPIEQLERVQPHRCAGGWVGEDAEGRPIPCRRCRPHLLPRRPEDLDAADTASHPPAGGYTTRRDRSALEDGAPPPGASAWALADT